MKVLLFTHEQDIDGIGSVILGNQAFGEFDYVPCKTFEIDKQVQTYINNKEIYQYDLIFVTDLCLHEPLLTLINNDENLNKKVCVLDHHKTEIANAKYKFVNVILTCPIGATSGTYLFYEYLKYKKYLKATPVLDEMVELTRQYDTWEWEKNNNQKARMLHLLFEQIGYKNYIDTMNNIVANNDEIIFSDNELKIIQDWEQKFEKDSQEILNNMIVYPVVIENIKYRVGYIFTEYKYRNDFPKLIKQDNINDIDIIGMFFPNMDVVSYRGIKEIDVSIVPTYFGGKGHKGAGTNPISNPKFQKVLSKVKFNKTKEQ